MEPAKILETFKQLPAHDAFDVFLENDLDPDMHIRPVLGKAIADDYSIHINMN